MRCVCCGVGSRLFVSFFSEFKVTLNIFRKLLSLTISFWTKNPTHIFYMLKIHMRYTYTHITDALIEFRRCCNFNFCHFLLLFCTNFFPFSTSFYCYEFRTHMLLAAFLLLFFFLSFLSFRIELDFCSKTVKCMKKKKCYTIKAKSSSKTLEFIIFDDSSKIKRNEQTKCCLHGYFCCLCVKDKLVRLSC